MDVLIRIFVPFPFLHFGTKFGCILISLLRKNNKKLPLRLPQLCRNVWVAALRSFFKHESIPWDECWPLGGSWAALVTQLL
jgi:hypothetical protein